MRVARIPIDDPRWSEFVASHPDAGPFHLPAWTSVIADCYRFPSFVLAVRDGQGEILAGAPCVEVGLPFGARRWVSLSFSDSCDLLIRPGVEAAEAVGALTEYVLAGNARELELRTSLPCVAGCHPVNVGSIHKVDLPPDPRDLHVRKSHRNLSNRARRHGVTVTRGRSAEDLATFYRLHTLTRRRQGVPVQPKRLFDLIGERFLGQDNGFVATARLDGEVISAAVYLSYNGTLVSKYHATGPTRTDDGSSQLIDMEMLTAACREGFHTLDLGRSDPGADGLRQYKAGWGAVESPLIYTHISSSPPGASFPSQGGLSRRVIRTAPPWVARALGEVLYRWTA